MKEMCFVFLFYIVLEHVFWFQFCHWKCTIGKCPTGKNQLWFLFKKKKQERTFWILLVEETCSKQNGSLNLCCLGGKNCFGLKRTLVDLYGFIVKQKNSLQPLAKNTSGRPVEKTHCLKGLVVAQSCLRRVPNCSKQSCCAATHWQQ